MSKGSRIQEAFCEERKEIVTIDEAHEAYFAQTPKKRFNFICSDKECGATIVGVNYDKEAPIRTPHFRRNDAHKHIPSCPWWQFDKTLAEMRKTPQKYAETAGNIVKTFESVDASDVFDIFTPKSIRENRENADAPREKLTRTTNTEQYIERIRKQTNNLAKIVNLFEQMSENDKQNGTITILREKFTYSQIFKPVRLLKNTHTWPHIYYVTDARVYKYSDGYTIFLEKITQYQEHRYITSTVFIPIPHELEPQQPEFFKLLHDAATDKFRINCYIFGLNRHFLCTPQESNLAPCCNYSHEIISRDRTENPESCVTFCVQSLEDIHFKKSDA